MSLSHRQHRIKRAPALINAIMLVVVIGLASLTAQPTLADDFYSEEYTLNGQVLSPEWESTNYYSLDLPLFDTNNGARTLIGYQVNLDLTGFYTASTKSNPTGNFVGCESHWEANWKGELNGQQWFPLDQESGYANFGQGYGAILWPFNDGITPELEGSGLELDRTFSDPALLAQLTGVGDVTIECTYTLSDITFFEPTRWPAGPGVFVPDLLNITMESLDADVTVTYFWTPEPTTLAIFGFGIVPLLRRRRR